MANRVSNGYFETNVEDWAPYVGDEIITRETAAPITGTGSLRCQFGEDTYAGVIVFNPGEYYQILVTAGESLPISFKVKGDCDLVVGLDWMEPGPADTIIFQDTVTSTPTVFSDTVVVPNGVTAVTMFFYTESVPDGEFTLDDVFVGTPDPPPATPAVTAALATRAGRLSNRSSQR